MTWSDVRLVGWWLATLIAVAIIVNVVMLGKALSAPSCIVTDTNPCSSLSGPWPAVSAVAHQPRQAARTSHWYAQPRAKCGWYQRKLGGFRLGPEFNLAQNWYRKLPRTHARPGAIAVWSRGGIYGHVARIVSVVSPCRAVVHDNKGTYERSICGGRLLGFVEG